MINLLQIFQVTTGIGTLVSVVIVAFLMANGHRIFARKLSGFAIALLVLFFLFTVIMMVLG